MAKARSNREEARGILDGVEPVTPVATEVPLQDVTPNPWDPEWTSWVLGQLEEGEVWETEDGTRRLPYTKGLRRFARWLFRESGMRTSVQAHPPLHNGEGQPPTLTVVHTIALASPPCGFPAEAAGLACRGPFNVTGRVAAYPGETADTVAEGRALTRLLGLNTITKDEVRDDVPTHVQASPTITASQIKSLEVAARLANLSVTGILKAGNKQQFDRVEELPSHMFYGLFRYLDGFTKRCRMGTLTEADQKFRDKAGVFDPQWRNAT